MYDAMIPFSVNRHHAYNTKLLMCKNVHLDAGKSYVCIAITFSSLSIEYLYELLTTITR